MNPEPPFNLEPDRAVPRWGFLGLSGIVILAAIAYFSLSRSPGVTLTAREDSSSLERSYLVDVRTTSSAERIYLPRLGVRAALREGRGQFRLGAQDLAETEGPLAYVLREPWYRADRRGKVVIAGLPAVPATDAASTEAPGDLLDRGSAAPESPPASERPDPRGTDRGTAPTSAPTGASPDTTTTAPDSAVAPPDAPAAADEAPPTPLRSAWARDRALESELAGRGVAGVTILRRGRSIRLRGTVGSDQALRTVYQFMNDKGFGEVDYGVEVR